MQYYVNFVHSMPLLEEAVPFIPHFPTPHILHYLSPPFPNPIPNVFIRSTPHHEQDISSDLINFSHLIYLQNLTIPFDNLLP